MKKHLIRIITFSFFLLTLFPVANASSATVTSSVWVEPIAAKTGDEVTLSAFLYNDQAQAVTFSISFFEGNKVLGKEQSVLIPAASGKTLTTKLIVPEEKTIVGAKVVKALGKDKKEIKELLGEIGSISLGGSTTKDPLGMFSGLEEKLKNIFSTIKGTIEPFRLKQYEHFSSLRDKAREMAGLKASELASMPQAPIPFSDQEGQNDFETEKISDPLSYPKLVVFTSLASFFGEQLLFYIALGILVFLLLRWLFRMFV